MTVPGRLSVNQKTLDQWTTREFLDGCARAGVSSVGLWREPVAATGLDLTVRLAGDAGLRVSSLCRGGFFAVDPHLDDNRRAIDEAAALGAHCLVYVVGGLPAGSRDLPGARARVAEAFAALAPYGAERGVRLAIEPMHPMFCADRGVVSTLAQALDLATGTGSPSVGVVVDSYHVWWDPRLAEGIAAAGDRMLAFQVSDWVLPLGADTLASRGMMGDGHIDLRGLRTMVDAAGYQGDVEVEIFNTTLWAADGADALQAVIRAYTANVA